MIYAISDAKAGCPNPLTLDGTPMSYVLIAPGTARAGQKRPSASLADYLEDANMGAWSGNPDFTVPDATKSNDQLRAE
jgi:hypothetical protein